MFLINGVNYGDFNFWINFCRNRSLTSNVKYFFILNIYDVYLSQQPFFILTPVSLALFAFGYTEAFFVAIALIIVATIVFTVTNIPDFRPLTGNPLKKDAMFLGIPLKGRWG